MRFSSLINAFTLSGLLILVGAGSADAQISSLKKKLKKAAEGAVAGAVTEQAPVPAGAPTASDRPYAEEFAALMKAVVIDPSRFRNGYYDAVEAYFACNEAAAQRAAGETRPHEVVVRERCGEMPDEAMIQREEARLAEMERAWPASLTPYGFTEDSYQRAVMSLQEHFQAYLHMRAEQPTGDLPGFEPETVALFETHMEELEKYFN